MEQWLLQLSWLWVERGLADPFHASRVLVDRGYRCTCLDLDRYDHGVEGLDWLLLVPVGSGAAMCASSGLV